MNTLVNIYNFYLRTLKHQLNIKEHPNAIRKIIDGQVCLAEMQRIDTDPRTLIREMQSRVKLITSSLPAEFALLHFSIDESEEEIRWHLDFYQLQKYKLNLIIDGLLGGMVYNLDDPRFKLFVERFCKIAKDHPLFSEEEKIHIGRILTEISVLRDCLLMHEEKLQSFHELIDSLPGKTRDQQIEMIDNLADSMNPQEEREILLECNEMMKNIPSAIHSKLSMQEKLCLLCARRIVNAVRSIDDMRSEVAFIKKAIMANHRRFSGQLFSIANSQHCYVQDDWDRMEKLMLIRDSTEIKSMLANMSLRELRHLRKKFEDPKVIALIDSMPSMREHLAAKYMRKRQMIFGYAAGRVSQAHAERHSLEKKFAKGKYKTGKKK